LRLVVARPDLQVCPAGRQRSPQAYRCSHFGSAPDCPHAGVEQVSGEFPGLSLRLALGCGSPVKPDQAGSRSPTQFSASGGLFLGPHGPDQRAVALDGIASASSMPESVSPDSDLPAAAALALTCSDREPPVIADATLSFCRPRPRPLSPWSDPQLQPEAERCIDRLMNVLAGQSAVYSIALYSLSRS